MGYAGPMSQTFQIGEWSFDAAAGDLRRGDERRRLEDRAARTLEVLCRRRGEVVSQDDIIGQVWNGRAVSANSVPVVIADLRRALGDDARAPRFIETVAKRGYRLLADGAAVRPPPSARHKLVSRLVVVGFIALLAAAAYATWRNSGPPPRELSVLVPDVANATGDSAYAPMAAAVSELVSADLMRARVPIERVRPGSDGGGVGDARTIRLSGKLILWTGQPTVMFTAEENGKVTWAGMAKGPEPAFPATVRGAMDDFARTTKAPPAETRR
jgi:DNA-binding winged helix-turn-helix (wHTH) protein